MSRITIKMPERHHVVLLFVLNLEHILHLFLMFHLLNLSRYPGSILDRTKNLTEFN